MGGPQEVSDSNPIADADTIRREKTAQRNRRLIPDLVNPKTGKLEREGEERRLLAVAGVRLQRLIIGALETGCRRGELPALRWRDVDLHRRELTVRAENTKTRKARVLPISPRLAGVLELVQTALVAALPTRGMTDQERAASLAVCQVFGDAAGRKIGNVKKAWETAVAKAHGHEPTWSGANRLSPTSRATLQRSICISMTVDMSQDRASSKQDGPSTMSARCLGTRACGRRAPISM